MKNCKETYGPGKKERVPGAKIVRIFLELLIL